MQITTGYGYYVQNGVIINKYELPIGTHTEPGNGITNVEVADQAALDAIVVPPTPAQVAIQTQLTLTAEIQANRDAYLDAVIAGDTVTQQSISTAQASLIAQAVTSNIALPASTVAFSTATSSASTGVKSGTTMGTTDTSSTTNGTS